MYAYFQTYKQCRLQSQLLDILGAIKPRGENVDIQN